MGLKEARLNGRAYYVTGISIFPNGGFGWADGLGNAAEKIMIITENAVVAAFQLNGKLP